ncbi:hypothetical protein EB796_019668 [Bugula neritina]|uniref:Uncharacterized protein n=1 Tax=Bugula neritina TaxID=10212 RepID=A0A7J7J8W7_BUGNE|nr:hypothetical protein EB796_019668 [Bugula neritina]
MIQPYYCFQSGIVSSCPAYFDDWKLIRDCEKSPTAWVYHTNGVYRNAFCAICNLGDDILSAQVEGVPGKGLLQSNYTYRILDIIYDYEWDRPITVRDAYLWLPFNTSYTDESSLHHAFTESVDISTLCLGIGDPFRIPIGAAVEGQVNFSPNPDIHTAAQPRRQGGVNSKIALRSVQMEVSSIPSPTKHTLTFSSSLLRFW